MISSTHEIGTSNNVRHLGNEFLTEVDNAFARIQKHLCSLDELMMQKLFRSVGHGIAGLCHVARTEINMRWHLLAAFIVSCCGIAFRISLIEWVIVVGCIGSVLALECLNTAIERLGDQISDQEVPLIGQAKDAAAGSVLIASLATGIIGLIIFLPKLLALLGP